MFRVFFNFNSIGNLRVTGHGSRVYFICLFIYLFLSCFVQRATGSPVYDCKVFYPSLNKVVIVIIIVIVTVNHSYYNCYYY